MAFRLATTAALVGGAAATINLAIQDCGDANTHGHVSGISPSSVEEGKATVVRGAGHVDTTVADGSFNINVKSAGVTVTSCKGDICTASKCALPAGAGVEEGKATVVRGAGHVDTTVADGSFNINVKSAGVTVTSCKGDICTASKCALPAGAGSVDFQGVACPLAAGDVSLDFDVSVSNLVPSSLETLDIEISAEGSAGKLLCAKLSTSPAAAVSATTDKAWENKEKEVEITLPWLMGGCSNKGHCGLAYQSCCIGFQAKGYPCGCKLSDGGSGESKGDCGDCGAAYQVCCAGYAASGNACTCDVTDGGVAV